MKTTQYFDRIRHRVDRALIKDSWISQVILNPEARSVLADGRVRLWARVAQMENRYLRVVLLADGVTVHNAFFDRSFPR